MNSSDPHNPDTRNQKMIRKIKQALDDETLDKDLRQQLQETRHLVLEQPQISFFSRYAIPAMSFASICAIAIVLTLSLSPTSESDNFNNIEAFEIMTTNDALEMYENLEFYIWLEEEFKV